MEIAILLIVFFGIIFVAVTNSDGFVTPADLKRPGEELKAIRESLENMDNRKTIQLTDKDKKEIVGMLMEEIGRQQK